MAGDRVQVVKDGDRRLGQFGTVVHIATQGAKVRFSDGQEEGFKRSSLHAPARLSFSARARTLQKLLPARAPQTAAQPLPPQRSQSAGAPSTGSGQWKKVANVVKSANAFRSVVKPLPPVPRPALRPPVLPS